MSLSRSLQYLFLAIIVTTVGFSLYQWNASRASTQKTAPNNGLVGYWSFDEGTGTKAGDASGNGNTGTLTNGPTWVAGKLGKALSFDGVNDYVYLGDVSTEATDYTVSLWYWYAQGSTAGNVFSRGRSSACFYNPKFYVDASGWLPIESGCSGDGYLNVVPLHNGWNHLVMTRSGQTAKSYLDGVLKQTDGSQPGGLGSNNSKMLIGNEYVSYSPDVYAGTLSGSVDEVRIYNRALSGTEVTNLYNLGAEKLNISPTASLTSGLVGYWTFDGKDTPWTSSSAGTATDRSGNGNTGTLTNMSRATSPAEGKLGQALNFDGVDDYINIPSSASYDTPAGTWSFWAKFNTLPATHPDVMLSRGDADSVYSGVSISLQNNATIMMQIKNYNGSMLVSCSSTKTVNDGSWHHVVGTFLQANGGTNNLYIDGRNECSSTNSAAWTFNSQPVRLADATDPYWEIVDGLLDDVRIYNRVLSAGEVQSLYDLGASDKVNSSVSQNQGIGHLDSGLVGYWKLDDNTGTTATDSSVNGNNGTLTNGPTWGAGRIGSDVVFDGVNDYIGTSYSATLEPTNAISVSLWLKRNGAQVTYATPIGHAWGDGSSPTYSSYGITLNYNSSGSDKATFALGKSGSFDVLTSTANAVPDNTWTHIVGIFNGVSMTLYVNGVPNATIARTALIAYTGTTAITSIGRDQYQTGQVYNGSIDEVRVYNRALSADEVSQLYRLTTPTGVDTSLKGYWSFNGPDLSGTTAYDRSGAGNNGTLTNGPAITEGKLGQALNLNGSTQYIDAGNAASLQLTHTGTVSAWVKTISGAGSYMEIMDKMHKNNDRNGYALGVLNAGNGNKFTLEIANGSTYNSVNSGTALVNNAWYHVVGTWDGSNLKIYINGVSDATPVAQTIDAVSTLYNLNIGRDPAVASLYWNGPIDEVRVYNRALSATEIAALYNSGR